MKVVVRALLLIRDLRRSEVSRLEAIRRLLGPKP